MFVVMLVKDRAISPSYNTESIDLVFEKQLKFFTTYCTTVTDRN